MYRIKEEYLEKWGADQYTCVNGEEIERLSIEWDCPIEELMKQVEEIEMEKVIEGSVYVIRFHWEDSDEIERRYVFARTGSEARAKFDAYNDQGVKDGFARMIAIDYCPTIENDFVIG